MSADRWIIVSGSRRIGRNGWWGTVRAAGPFTELERAETCLAVVRKHHDADAVIRRVVPAGTSRKRADAQADADTIATMRVELDGLRATDEEMAAKLAQAQREAEEHRAFVASICEALGGEFGPAVVPAVHAMRAALATSRHHLKNAMGFESQSRAAFERMRIALGATSDEDTVQAAERVVRERDEARAAIAPPLPHVAFLQRLSDATGVEVASDDFEVRVLAFVHDLASMRSEILDIAARTPRATVKASPC